MTCHQCRYEEHVLEANENPNWVCPVCRGICNCSSCRKAKGWAPTGPLYKKVSPSVVHFLAQTFFLLSKLLCPLPR
ncbi:cell division cycle-associated protein 7-like [Hibiscus syriacus]|uniref:cell division cycle-associated protein 7-like n=1 Tax=Hibiscus syriacus TaxID=106335 RepID=UPI0019247117|nr:cell division cycle-associated protein 7-like [Hibiscus syriacus]